MGSLATNCRRDVKTESNPASWTDNWKVYAPQGGMPCLKPTPTWLYQLDRDTWGKLFACYLHV